MSVQDLGAIGEFIASLVVLITLVFLTIETRQNTRAIRRANVRNTTADHVTSLLPILDEQMADIMMRGWSDLDNLSQLERYRFDISAYTWLASAEQAFADHADGAYPEESLIIFKNNIPGVMRFPGGQRWWSERKVWFTPGFREIVEGLFATPNIEAQSAGVPPTGE